MGPPFRGRAGVGEECGIKLHTALLLPAGFLERYLEQLSHPSKQGCAVATAYRYLLERSFDETSK